MSASTSLLQDVLRPHAFGVEKLNSKLAAASIRNSPPSKAANLDDSDEDELVGVVSPTLCNVAYTITDSAYRCRFPARRRDPAHRLALSPELRRRPAPVPASGVLRVLSTYRRARPKTLYVLFRPKCRSESSAC